MPLALYRRRSQIGTSACSFFIMMNLILGTYYLPFYVSTIMLISGFELTVVVSSFSRTYADAKWNRHPAI